MSAINNFLKNQKLWQQALTHRSFLNETKRDRLGSNERLEFLGDAVLSLVVSEWLYQKFPDFSEGKLTNLRSLLVKTETLARIAEEQRLGEELRMSRGERESGGGKNQSLLADCFEAIIGALWLDRGIKTTQEAIRSNLEPILDKIMMKGEFKDGKSLLQERLQAISKESPRYQVLKTAGPDHARIFTTGVFHQKRLLAKGWGTSKQMAEEAAAKRALEKIKKKR